MFRQIPDQAEPCILEWDDEGPDEAPGVLL